MGLELGQRLRRLNISLFGGVQSDMLHYQLVALTGLLTWMYKVGDRVAQRPRDDLIQSRLSCDLQVDLHVKLFIYANSKV